MAATMSFRQPLSTEQHYNFPNMDQEMQLVPDFVFPPRPVTDQSAHTSPRRSAPMNLAPGSYHARSRSMRQSASALPTFSFNASDTSGRLDNQPPSPNTMNIPTSPPKSAGHRRGASELVGGDSRLGIGGVLGTSPSKPLDTLPIPQASGSPARKRGHAHRRSAAISGHDLASILQPRDANMQFQAPGPQTPTELIPQPQYPSPAKSMIEDHSAGVSLMPGFSPIPAISEEAVARPPSRPRVGFSEKIEFIPRPLSTVSADTTSSVSTFRGHSVGNSLSSIINLGGIGHPSPRRTMLSIDDFDTDLPSDSLTVVDAQDSIDPEKSVDQQSPPIFALPTHSSPIATAFAGDDTETSKKNSFLKLDRRRSEPLMSLSVPAVIGNSSVSLQEPIGVNDPIIATNESEKTMQGLNRVSSRKRVKKWATSILGKKTKNVKKAKSASSNLEEAQSDDLSSDTDAQAADSSEEEGNEPDLDALFGQDPFTDHDDFASSSIISPRSGTSESFMPFFSSSSYSREDTSPVIDLDAALGPYGTPSMSWEASHSAPKRRQLHSSRLTKDFTGPGMHYHRRTESAPALVPFEFCGRASSPGQSPMADVFEEEEDDEIVMASSNEPSVCDGSSQAEEELGTGIQIVDVANDQHEPNFDWSFEEGLGIERNDSTSGPQPIGLAPQLPTPPGIRRTSVVEDTIIEEAVTCETAIDCGEPRSSSVTKSSDSSDARTIQAENNALEIPSTQPQNAPLTPTSNFASTFSSPDFTHNQGSFDTSRLGTSASSIADSRTMSSFTTTEPTPDIYMSADDVPSLTSSRSTMISTMYQTSPRRETMERPVSVACANVQGEQQASERRRKRSSIQSLSMLLGGPFGESRSSLRTDQRPQTAIPPSTHEDSKRKKENRLSKLMFWRSKSGSRNLFQSK